MTANRPSSRKGRTARVAGSSLRVALPVMPHQRVILAASCPLCGRLLPPSEFYEARGRVNYSKCRRCVSWGKVKLPVQPIRRTVIAKSCRTCGSLCMAADFYDRETDCKECNKKRALAWQADNPARAQQNSTAARDRAQARTLPAAHWGEYWTGPELEIVARADLTDEQIATMLGRTVYAVRGQRHLLTKDPRKANLAGVA